MKVSVIISNRNDLEMLSVTLNSCIEALSMIPESDIIVCDNSDDEIWEALPLIISHQYLAENKVKFIRQDYPCLFTARERAIRESNAEYVICVDGHMLIGHNTFWDLYTFMESHDTRKVGFAHAPLKWVNRHESIAVIDRKIDRAEMGPWGMYDGETRPITWKGMPWICRRSFFLNDLNGYGALAEHKLSWGGGDIHIGTKPWLLGFQNWGVETRPCTHIGPFPEEMKEVSNYRYRLYSDSGHDTNTLGFLVVCYVLGGEAMMDRNAEFIRQRFKLDIEGHWDRAIEYGKNERKWLLANQVMSYEEYLGMMSERMAA